MLAKEIRIWLPFSPSIFALLYYYQSTDQFSLPLVCPLVFPNMKNITKACGDGMNNQTTCCNTVERYVSHLQRQSFVTNLQALDCAASLGLMLQKDNVSKNVYNLCHISLKDFSVQGQFLFECSLVHCTAYKYVS